MELFWKGKSSVSTLNDEINIKKFYPLLGHIEVLEAVCTHMMEYGNKFDLPCHVEVLKAVCTHMVE